jgi:hypothetical protein
MIAMQTQEVGMTVLALALGRVDGVAGGRTVHVDLRADVDSIDDSQIIYFVYTDPSTNPYNVHYFQSFVSFAKTAGVFVRIYMFQRVSLAPDGFEVCIYDLPLDSLRWPTLLSFTVAVTPLSEPNTYDVHLAIFLNGTRGKSCSFFGSEYHATAGDFSVGRMLPCAEAGDCGPFFGTLYSVAIDEEPLNHSIVSYDNWNVCKADGVPTSEANTTTSIDGSSSTAASLVLTGRDLDGGGAVGLDEEESSGDQGAGVPLTLIIVIAALVVVCMLSLGALLVWRSRRRERTLTTSRTVADSSSTGQPLSRSRSSKRRRRDDATYTKIDVSAPDDDYEKVPSLTMTEYSPMPDGSSTPDYSTMPTTTGGDLGESGYRSLPSVDGGDEYRTLPTDKEYGTMPVARTHAYGGVEGGASTSTYTELSRPKNGGAEEGSYASGNLGVDE